MEKKVVDEVERIKEQVEERTKERVEDLEKKLLACGKTTKENNFVPASSVPMPISPVSYFVDGLKEEEIQKVVKMADVQDLKSALLYALNLEAATQGSHKDRYSIRTSRLTADEPCEFRCIKEIEKFKKKMQAFFNGSTSETEETWYHVFRVL
ncbi:uncharacterized protein TNCV_3443151 [Trichonephila clavipes]|nr:uncharacterized protein TNCV_3443151 [Trichonephila clavipes]